MNERTHEDTEKAANLTVMAKWLVRNTHDEDDNVLECVLGGVARAER